MVKVSVETNDNQVYQLEEHVYKNIGFLTKMVEEFDDDNDNEEDFPLTEVDSTTMLNIIKFYDMHKHDPYIIVKSNEETSKREIQESYHNFLKEMVSEERKYDDVFNLLTSSNYLECKELLNLVPRFIAKIIVENYDKNLDGFAEAIGVTKEDLERAELEEEKKERDKALATKKEELKNGDEEGRYNY